MRALRGDDVPARMVRISASASGTASLGMRGMRLQVQDTHLVLRFIAGAAEYPVCPWASKSFGPYHAARPTGSFILGVAASAPELQRLEGAHVCRVELI
jgi:hypothetical protein